MSAARSRLSPLEGALMLRSLVMGLALISAAPVLADDLASMRALRVAGGAVSRPALTVSYRADRADVGELRLPAGKGPFPVVVLIHGGCWQVGVGSPLDVAPLADALTRNGFATWSIEYRKVGEPGGGWPGTFEDVGAAVDYVRTLATTHPLDLTRVVLLGHSSGAHLALWAASRRKLGDPIAGDHPLQILAVVAIDGPGALAPFIGVDAQVCGKPAIVPLMGGTPTEKPRAYTLASPAEHLPLGVHQILVLGELAPLMQPYVAAAQASGDMVDVVAPRRSRPLQPAQPIDPHGSAGTRRHSKAKPWRSHSAAWRHERT